MKNSTTLAMQWTSDFVQMKILGFVNNNNESATRATLARLRRGIGKSPGALPEIWEATLSGLPSYICGEGSEAATPGEWASYTALTLFAMHQQGRDLKTDCMNCKGVSLGAAMCNLITSEEEEERVKRRFDAAATSDNPAEFAFHLRGLVQLMKAKKQPLDYPALARDLVLFQDVDKRDSVRLSWGRDFYRMRTREDDDNGKQ